MARGLRLGRVCTLGTALTLGAGAARQAYLVVAEVGAGGKMVGSQGKRGGGGGGSMRNELVFLAAPVDLEQLRHVAEALVTREESVFWGDGKKVVLAREITRIGSLVIQEVPQGPAKGGAELISNPCEQSCAPPLATHQSVSVQSGETQVERGWEALRDLPCAPPHALPNGGLRWVRG